MSTETSMYDNVFKKKSNNRCLHEVYFKNGGVKELGTSEGSFSGVISYLAGMIQHNSINEAVSRSGGPGNDVRGY